MTTQCSGDQPASSASMVTVEILTAQGCPYCRKTAERVANVVAEFGAQRVVSRRVDVVEHIDYAVKLGVSRTPAVAIDGVLVFVSVPAEARLRRAIEQYLERDHDANR